MFVEVIAKIPADFFSRRYSNTHTSANSKVRIIIKEHGGNWQETVLRNKIGLAKDTKIVMNCYPGSKIDHNLIRQLTFIRTLQELDEPQAELRQIFTQLQENQNTSPVKLSADRYHKWYRFVNEKLWRKFHMFNESSIKSLDANEDFVINIDEWRLYQLVNKKYAKALARDIVNDILSYRNIAFDVNWLHDYQLMLVFPYLKHYLTSVIEELAPKTNSGERTYRFSEEEKIRLYRGVKVALNLIKTSYFHHIPWPDVETFKAEFPVIEDTRTSSSDRNLDEKDKGELSSSSTKPSSEPEFSSFMNDRVDVGKEIISGLLSSDHVAFQTEKDAKYFNECVRYYYPDAETHQVNARQIRVCLPEKKINVHVNPIGTDYTLFSTVDFTERGIVQYLSSLLNVSIEGIYLSEEINFTKKLTQLIEATKLAYLNALIKTYLSELKEKRDLIAEITKIITPENLLPSQVGQTKGCLLALLNCENPKLNLVTDEFLKEAQRASNTLQQAYNDLFEDYITLEQLKKFKDNTAGTQLFTSIGRLDPEKNVPTVLEAYLSYIQECVFKNEEIKNSLLLFIVPSRLDVPAYRQELKTILGKYDEIKVCISRYGKIPENYVFLAEERLLREVCDTSAATPSKPKLITPNAMAEFYRLGNVIISSRADGMNLVVKEWVSAQDRVIKNCLHALFNYAKHYPYKNDKGMTEKEKLLFIRYVKALRDEFLHNEHLNGVLSKLSHNFISLLDDFFKQYQGDIPLLPMLSKNAGAAIQLKQACIIDPFNFMSIKEQFQTLSDLDTINRVARALDLKRNVQGENAQEWRHSIIDQILTDQTLDNAITQISRKLVSGEELIFIDYDGTIAPHVNNFNEAWPNQTSRLALITLMKIAPDRIIFITGRDVSSFEHCFWGGPESQNLHKIPLTVIGSHGLEIKRRNGKHECLLSLNEHERALINKLQCREQIDLLKIKLITVLQQHIALNAIDEIDFDALIEIKNYAIALSMRSLSKFINNTKTFEVIEHQFAQILEDHYLKDIEGKRIATLSKFSIWQGIHTCELRYNFTKADAARQLLTEDAYRNTTHITFMGDDFGQPEQPGTDYSLAQWIKSQDTESFVIQVIPEENYEQQKQLVTSPALPNLVLTSTLAMGQMLKRISQHALEIKSRKSFINKSIEELGRQITQQNILLPSTVNSSDSIDLHLSRKI